MNDAQLFYIVRLCLGHVAEKWATACECLPDITRDDIREAVEAFEVTTVFSASPLEKAAAFALGWLVANRARFAENLGSDSEEPIQLLGEALSPGEVEADETG